MQKAGARKQALLEGHSKYIGKVCAVHPELAGLRYAQGSNCIKCQRTRTPQCLAKCRRARAATRVHTKAIVFQHYGSKCARCGITDIDVLTIDHVAQDGASHRFVHRSGNKFYRWLQRNSYPPGFRVLCFNCNVKVYLLFVRDRERKRDAKTFA